ncbi:hypothetical protein [Nocardioides massiliensis]|uniref:CRISPR/Cas system-associated endonuclease/helicase Cas3 n=1 Tax=Nocardioides massiliensis TaxID=1325935 RepID=A0ABT9NM04_9ACTN|nr:hypothetical protein [Nocardioides massiliensis]MDP9821070.1 CRISPR/Cas system-associated endonuclease/helicase Cas3 [Nocardioides massiliensis]
MTMTEPEAAAAPEDDRTTVLQPAHKLFQREDGFGPYLSVKDHGVFAPKLNDMPKDYPDQVRQAMLKAALENAPEPEKPETWSDALVDQALAFYASSEMRAKEAPEARKAAARWLLDQDPKEPTAEEVQRFKTNDLFLAHAHRVKERVGVVSLSILAGWAYEEDKNGDLKKSYVRKEVVKAIRNYEDARKAAKAAKDAADAAAETTE